MIRRQSAAPAPVASDVDPGTTEPALAAANAAREAAATEPSTVSGAEVAETGGATASGRGPALARVYEEGLRVDSRFRWSVGGARPVCSQCHTEIAPSSSFHTVLVEAPAGATAAEPGDLLEVFERRDLCETCFQQADRSAVFAFWKSVLPAARGEVKKSVNVVSLRAYLDRLVDSLRESRGLDGTDRGEVLTLDRDQSADPGDDVTPHGGGVEEGGLDTVASGTTLAYLLGLFLVRKRNLRWGEITDGVLTLFCRTTDRAYRLHAPNLSAEDLQKGIRAFEELFG
ncbi:MAG: hypothetical protein AB7O52_13960 [Planctomycetota bacterium]